MIFDFIFQKNEFQKFIFKVQSVELKGTSDPIVILVNYRDYQ
jgi:hypothetical protein